MSCEPTPLPEFVKTKIDAIYARSELSEREKADLIRKLFLENDIQPHRRDGIHARRRK